MTTSIHLPVLQVIIPLLSAPICVLLRHERLVRAFATMACLASLVVAYSQWDTVTAGVVSYHIGGWAPPWGIELRADRLSVLVLILVTTVASAALFSGIGARSHAIPRGRESYFYAAFLLCLTGLVGMTSTGDAFNVFVFLEIASLSTYTLVALGRSRRALKAAFSYLVLGSLGGTFILLGIGFLYQLTGTLNMADLSERLADVSHNRAYVVAFVFLMVGLGLKLAVFPLHQWLPNAYAQAPSAASSFLAGSSTKVTYYLAVRFIFAVFGAVSVYQTLHLRTFLMPMSLMAMFFGSIAAIYQNDFKRLLAYSSVAQLGYMTLGLSLGTHAGVQAGLVHLVNHALMKSGLFMVAATIVAKIGTSQLSEMAGLGKKMPMTMVALVIGGLGLIGVPGTSGFISKWYLVSAAFDNGDHYLAAGILLSSLLAVAYVWRLVELLYFRDPRGEAAAVQDEPLSSLAPALLMMSATVFLGLFPHLVTDSASAIAADLFGGTR